MAQEACPLSCQLWQIRATGQQISSSLWTHLSALTCFLSHRWPWYEMGNLWRILNSHAHNQRCVWEKLASSLNKLAYLIHLNKVTYRARTSDTRRLVDGRWFWWKVMMAWIRVVARAMGHALQKSNVLVFITYQLCGKRITCKGRWSKKMGGIWACVTCMISCHLGKTKGKDGQFNWECVLWPSTLRYRNITPSHPLQPPSHL